MRALEKTLQGLQFLLLSNLILGMSVVLMTLSVMVNVTTPESLMLEKLHTLAQMALVIGLAVSSIGKLACLGNPEEEARLKCIQTLPMEVLVWTTVPVALSQGWDFLVVFAAALAHLVFLRFLCQLNKNAGGVHQETRIVILLGTFGTGFLAYLFSSPQLIFGQALLITCLFTGLYLFMRIVWSVLRVLPLYLEEVRMGLTDATISPDERTRLAREERLSMARTGTVDSDRKVGSEQPQGEPPEGALLYRIPRALSALHFAVKDGNSDRVASLLIDGADVSGTVAHQLSPLHIACSTGVLEVTDRLVKAGANMDQAAECGLTPLFFAAQTGNRNLVGYLVAKGAKLKQRNNQGLTPLHWVCSVIHPRLTTTARLSMINCLLDLGASHRMKTLAGETPMELAARYDLQYVVELFEKRYPILKKRQASFTDEAVEINLPERNLENPFQALHLSRIPELLSPFHEAVKQGELEKMEAGLGEPDSLKEQWSHGRTAIHLAAVCGIMSTVHRLLEAGANVNEKAIYDVSPLMLATHRGNLATVGYLIAQGAKPNAKDDMGRTALHWAAAAQSPWLEGSNRVNMVKFLVEHGADPNQRDNNEQRPLDLAKEAFEEAVVTLLDDSKSDEVEEVREEDEYYL